MTARSSICTAVATALLVAGCGGGSDDSESPARATATATAKATGGEPADATPVAIRDFEYRPAKVSVDAGSTVTWVDRDAANHTVTFKDRRQSGVSNIRTGERKTVRFDSPGTYAYICAYHPNMHGSVVVR